MPFNVIKSSGKKELFDIKKFRRSLNKVSFLFLLSGTIHPIECLMELEPGLSDRYKICVIKLGGSAITVKEQNFGVARYDIISNMCKEIASFLSEHPDTHRIVLVNGCGSYAHTIANNYELHLRLDENNIDGVVEYNSGARKINKIVVKALNYHGVRALAISPMSCVVCRRGRIVHINTDVIKILLDQGFVPVLHGDIVVDEEMGMTIISSDLIAANLGYKLHAHRVGYASIENGVYDDDRKVISEINDHNFDDVKKFIGGSKHTDVTGGMLAKVCELLGPHAPAESYIFNGTKDGNLLKFLDGKELGTKVVKRSPCIRDNCPLSQLHAPANTECKK